MAPRRSYRSYRAPGRHAFVIAPPRGAITPKSGCYRGQKHVIAHQKGAITNAPCDNTGPPAITKRGGALLQLVFVPWIARKSARRASSERASQFSHELLHACFAGLLVLVRKPTQIAPCGQVVPREHIARHRTRERGRRADSMEKRHSASALAQIP